MNSRAHFRLPTESIYLRHAPRVVACVSGVALACATALTAVGQSTTPLADSGWQPVEHSTHQTVWQRVTQELDDQGNPVSYTNQYVQLETGLNFSEDGRWLPTQAEFKIVNDHAVAQAGPHKVILAGNINAPGSVDLWTPDGKRFVSNPMGLSFYDSASGKNVLLAEVKDCVGELAEPNVVIYPDAFTDMKGAIRYTYTKAGLEQDVVLYDNPGRPEDYGLDPVTTRLEMYTEFHQAPVPERVRRMLTATLTDVELDFGEMQIGAGRAFSLGNRELSAPVGKDWSQLADPATPQNPRNFLTESVEYPSVVDALQELPAPQAALTPQTLLAKSSRSQTFTTKEALLRHLQAAAGKSAPMQVRVARLSALAAPKQPALVIDYITASSQANMTFKGDVTYFVGGLVTLSGTTVFESGSVIKYTNLSTAKISITGPVSWQGTAYRPVVLTARDDQSVGESITPTNALSGYYANTALSFDSGSSASTIQNIRIAHAQTALSLNVAGPHVLRHVQFVNCQNGISATSTEFRLRNALFDHVTTAFTGSSSVGRVEHLTIDTATWLNNNIGTGLYLTNCLFAAVANFGSFSATNYCATFATTNGLFQTVGAGAHYLATGACRNLGTNTVDATLFAELKKRTTYAPQELTADFIASVALGPQAQRDTDALDIGYHYDPLDYVWSSLNLTNATLTLTNGVAVGIYGPRALTLRTGSSLVSEGMPANLNRLVRYQTVQEQPVQWGSTASTLLAISASTYPDISLRFTDISLMADALSRLRVLDATAFNAVSAISSQLRGASLLFNHQSSRTVAVALVNCLIHRPNFTFNQTYGASSYPLVVQIYNNLFLGGTNVFTYSTSTWPWAVKDNLFDGITLTSNGSLNVPNGYNGYTTGTTALAGGSNNKTGLTPDYQAGPLGNYYYPASGGSLTQLFDAGSRTRETAGLYHFTVKPATGTKEGLDTLATVDIGYHCAGVGTDNLPSDYDGDGLPDYAEDRDGDNVLDSGETDWQTSNSGISGATGLQVFTPLK